jgi:hypothetical protein
MNRENNYYRANNEVEWKAMLERVEEIVSILEERYNCKLEKEEESDFCDSDRHRFNVVKYLQYQN